MNPSLRLTVGLFALLLGACATVSEDTQDILSTQATESITVDASSVVNSLQADSIGINTNTLPPLSERLAVVLEHPDPFPG